jgi:hypothetical protein
VSAADALDDVFEQSGSVGHVFYFAVFERCFEDPWPGLSVPSLDVGGEAFAGCEDVVVPGLIMDGASEGVAGHAFRQVRKRVRWLLLEKGGCGRGIECGFGRRLVCRSTKLVEFELGCKG